MSLGTMLSGKDKDVLEHPLANRESGRTPARGDQAEVRRRQVGETQESGKAVSLVCCGSVLYNSYECVKVLYTQVCEEIRPHFQWLMALSARAWTQRLHHITFAPAVTKR